MNQTKSAIPPIKAPVVPASAPATPKQPQPKPSNVERLERALVGKFFSFVFDEGTRFRAGKFESVINDAYFMVRYFAMKDGTPIHLCRALGKLETSTNGRVAAHLYDRDRRAQELVACQAQLSYLAPARLKT